MTKSRVPLTYLLCALLLGLSTALVALCGCGSGGSTSKASSPSATPVATTSAAVSALPTPTFQNQTTIGGTITLSEADGTKLAMTVVSVKPGVYTDVMSNKWSMWFVRIRVKNIGTTTWGPPGTSNFFCMGVDERGAPVMPATRFTDHPLSVQPGVTANETVCLDRQPSSSIAQINYTIGGDYPLAASAFGIWDVSTPAVSPSPGAQPANPTTVGSVGTTFSSASAAEDLDVTLDAVTYFPELTTVRWSDVETAGPLPKETFKNVVGLEFSLVNVGSSPYFVSEPGTAIGQYGQSLNRGGDPFALFPNQLEAFYLCPGQSITGWSYFDNPSKQKVAKVEFNAGQAAPTLTWNTP